MHKTWSLVAVLAVASALGGCSWGIKLNDAGHSVRTDWNGNMSGCQRLGKVTVSVADHVGPFSRNDIKVRDELEVMARNEAGTMAHADTVHPLAEPVNGSQPWGVYHCGVYSSHTAQPAGSANGVKVYPLKPAAGATTGG